MTSRDFAFWLQGYFEVSGTAALTAEQGDLVKRHLALVFKHEIDPAMGGEKKQKALDALHGPPRPDGSVMRC